jgi:O-succinylbenzoic acid--CoA ligase
MRSRFASLDDLYWFTPQREGVEVVDEDGHPSKDNAEGELRVRLRDVDATGYLDDPQTTAKMFRNGYFYPGDIAVRRQDGRIRVLGRADDVLNLKGWKAPVVLFEQRIGQALGLDTVCVFAEVDEEGDQRVVVAVEAEQPPSETRVKAALSDFMGFKRIRTVAVRSFPRTEGGMSKIDRRKLRALVTPPAQTSG